MTFKTLAAGTLLVLAVAACGSSTASSGPTSAPSAAQASDAGTPAAAANAIAITERDFKFDTPEVTATGTQVSLAVTNAGPTVHDLTVRDAAGRILGETEDLKAGASETLTIQLPAGSYTIFCSLPGHESLGLKGTLTVTK
jgi:plastocyanin